MRRLFVFDMDGTLLPGTSGLLAMAAAMRTEAELAAMEREYSAGRLTTVAFTRRLYELWGQVPRDIVAEAFTACPKLTGIREVTAAIAARGDVSCLITMSQDFFANMFASYGFDRVYATPYPAGRDAVVDEAAVLTPLSKVTIVRALCGELGLTFSATVAFGDSLSDLPLFEALVHTVAVNADPRLAVHSAVAYRGNSLLEAYAIALSHCTAPAHLHRTFIEGEH